MDQGSTSSPHGGVQGRDSMDIDPGSMGQMDPGSYNGGGGDGYGESGFEEEQPLLKELGIDFDLIRQKVGFVLFPCTHLCQFTPSSNSYDFKMVLLYYRYVYRSMYLVILLTVVVCVSF